MQSMATRWAASVADLHEVTAPTGLRLSFQASAAAVGTAHAAVTAFTEGLAVRVGGHAAGVVRAHTSYVAQDAESTAAMTAVHQPAGSD